MVFLPRTLRALRSGEPQPSGYLGPVRNRCAALARSGKESGAVAAKWRAEETTTDGVHRLELHGELDLSAARDFESACAAAADRAPDTLDVDLTNVTYFDSSSVRALLRVVNTARDDGKIVRVTHASAIARRVLELTGVAPLLGLDEKD
jgi:anti-anti-sigma factor